MKKSELKDYVKEQIVDVLSTEAQDDRIDNPKFGPAPMEFQTMRDTLGDKKMLDRIQMLNVNDLEELLNALTFVVQKEASEKDVENQAALNKELEKTADLMSKMDMKEEDVEEANYSNVAVDKSDFAVNKYKKAADYKKSYDSLADKKSQDQFDDDSIDKKAAKMAGSRKEKAKASKQDKIIKDFKRIEAQMKTHLELFKTSESPKNKEIAKQMLKKLTPEYQAAKKAYDKLKNVKV